MLLIPYCIGGLSFLSYDRKVYCRVIFLHTVTTVKHKYSAAPFKNNCSLSQAEDSLSNSKYHIL